jgi:hypothetical protein
MNRTAAIVLFLIVAALTAFLVVLSPQCLPRSRVPWRHLNSALSWCWVGAIIVWGGFTSRVTLKHFRGDAYRWSAASGTLLFGLAAGMLLGGAVLLAGQRPQYVWGSWLWLGAWWSLVMPAVLWGLARRWRTTEMRRLQTRDISST